MGAQLKQGFLLIALLTPVTLIAAPPTFTGDVPADFTDPAVITIVDIGGVDIGMPLAYQNGEISGFDVKDVR